MILAAIASCKKNENQDFGMPEMGVSTESVDFSKEGGQYTISLYSTRDWTAQLDSAAREWLTVSPEEGAPSKDSVSVIISALPNAKEDRHATISFDGGAVNATVYVFQTGEIQKEYTPIADVRALYTGEQETVTVTEAWTVCGTVISNVDLNNATSMKNVVIQDESAGIMIRLTKDYAEFKRGDVVEVNVQNMSLEQFNGLLQLNNVPLENVTEIRQNAMPEAKVISAAQLLTGDYESQYVAVENVQVVESDLGKTWMMNDQNTSINFEAETGERFEVRTSFHADALGKIEVPGGSGTLKGIAQCYYETAQIMLSSTEDYADLTGERFEGSVSEGGIVGDYNTWKGVGPLASFSDDFSSISSKDQQYINDNWLFYSNAGTNVNDGFKTGTYDSDKYIQVKTGTYDSDKYIQVAPYNASIDEVIAFALPPRADMTKANPKTFSFRKALYHLDDGGDDSKMEVVVSTNFTGDFTSATWTVVKDVTFPEGAECNQWIEETIDLSGYASESALCIALRYTGKSNTYRIDDVAFGSGENVDPDPQPGELVEIADVRALYQGSNVTVSEDWYIRATVISNVDLNNGSSKKNIVMQDETAGIMVRLTQDEGAFKLGDVVEVNIQGQSLENFNGLIQLNNVPNANISKVSDGTVPEPKNITAAQLISGDYESQYVAVSDVQVVAEDLGKTFVMNNSNTSITFESRTGETFDLFTSRWAESLKSVQVPEGSGTLKGIAGINKDTYQISLTSTDDYAGLTGERFGEAAYTFSINPTSQRVSSEGGSFDITVTSNVAWTVSSDNSAFTVNPTSGNGNGTVTVQYTANTDASERTATITVSTTDENIANKTLTCSVTQSAQGASTDEPVVATIAEVLAAEVNDNVWYQITGMITNIENTSYGNFTIEDETGSIYVWGLTAEKVDKNDQSFSTLGLSEGDILTLVGTRDEHYGDPQVGGPAYYISHEEGELPETPVLITGTEGDGIYTSSVDLTQPSVNSNDEKWNNYEFTIGGEDYPAIKIGTSSVPGAYSFNLGKSGSCTLTMYAIAWNGKKTHAKVEISGGGTINGMSYVELDCQANSGLAGSDTTLPITFGTKDFYTMSIEDATESTVITVTTDGMANERIGNNRSWIRNVS